MKIAHVDAFAERPFGGNPAAVCLLPEARPDAWLQSVAQEMNLSETAFLVKREDGYSLRWFTPKVEVDLCGHATLASAHILWQDKILGENEIARFHTRSGLLTARRDDGWIELDFPSTPAAPETASPEVARMLGAPTKFYGRTRFDFMAEVESEDVVRGLKPDLAAMKNLGTRGVIVTAATPGKEYDFVSRYFAPGAGIDEDPVTGSTHCALAPYWGQRLKKDRLTAYQASARGGLLRLTVAGDRVRIAGKAVTVLRGELLA